MSLTTENAVMAIAKVQAAYNCTDLEAIGRTTMNFRHLLGAKPDPTLHNPDAAYIRSLVDACGLTQAQAAEAIDISERAMRNYLSKTAGKYIAPPYPVQYALEQLAAYTGAGGADDASTLTVK